MWRSITKNVLLRPEEEFGRAILCGPHQKATMRRFSKILEAKVRSGHGPWWMRRRSGRAAEPAQLPPQNKKVRVSIHVSNLG